MARVFVANHAGHDISSVRDAVPDADIIYLTEGNVNVFSLARLTEDFKLKMLTAQENDYILLSGHIILNVLATSIMLTRFGRVNLLLWQAKEHKYMPRELTSAQMAGDQT